MRFKTVNAISLLVMAGVLIAACRPAGNQAVVDVAANTSLTAWLQSAADQFNKTNARTASGKVAHVQIDFVEAGRAASDIAAGAARPALWIPDDEVWTAVLARRGVTDYQGNCRSVARSPLVIAMWRPVAQALGWPGRSLGWLDLGSLAADPSAWAYYSGGKFGPTLRMGHTHPGLSGSGASTLLAIVQAARSKTDAVTVNDIKEPIVQASVGAFEGTVAWFSPSTDKLGQTMQERGVAYLAAAVVYESTVVQHGGGGDEGVVAVYPFEGTFVAQHPACLDGAGDADAQEAARAFRDYLLTPDAQKAALANGLRPADGAAPIGAPLDSAHGVDSAQPGVVFNQPAAETIFAVSELWQSARKDVNLVMLIDTSGSMRGDKIDNVRAAAVEFVKQMGNDDYLTLITFSNRPNVLIEHQRVGAAREDAIRRIGGIEASGNTPLYDAIGDAAEIIKRTTGAQTSNAMALLSDGQDTSSSRYGFDQSLIDGAAANDTTVFTIAYGDDADKQVLSQLAGGAKGNFYLGTEANIGSIYEEMSAAFGGSAGIGR